jgi:hypothetical protein
MPLLDPSLEVRTGGSSRLILAVIRRRVTGMPLWQVSRAGSEPDAAEAFPDKEGPATVDGGSLADERQAT